MNFRDTLLALHEETKTTAIFAMRSYGDGKHGIGFRRECCGSDLKDPCIDDVPFMLCADAWKAKNLRKGFDDVSRKILTMEDFIDIPKEDIEIRLRAVSGSYPMATIALGDYEIISRKVVQTTTVLGKKFPERIQLDIKRIEH